MFRYLLAFLFTLSAAGAMAQQDISPKPQGGAAERRGAPPARPDKPAPPRQPAAPAQQTEQSKERPPAAAAQRPSHAEQLRKVGVSTCLPVSEALAAHVVDTDYTVLSEWNRGAPDQHAVKLVFGMKYDQPGLRSALAYLFAAPLPAHGGCEGVALQIIPTVLSCEALAKRLVDEGGRRTDPLGDLAMLVSVRGERVTLLPSATTCIIVSTTLAGTR